MIRTCRGCRADVEIDPTSGQVQTPDGLARPANFTDGELVAWQCPDCEYPHVDDVSPV